LWWNSLARGANLAPMILLTAAETHPGYVRSNNEDAHLLLGHLGLVVVADGMAGHRYGELASAIAVKTVRKFYESEELDHLLRKQFRRSKEADLVSRGLPFEQFKLQRALEEANVAIVAAAVRNPQYETMGTTIVAAVVSDRSLFVAHVGDSRIYRFRRGKLAQLTHDHSLLNEYLRMNFIRPEDAASFPLKNVIVRALGLQENVVVDTAMKTAREGDFLLLCSDGLSDLVADDDIASAFEQEDDPGVIARHLIDMALDAGGLDNITVAVARIGEEA
jgi:serine/threonine protein phosphatase PrpC